MQYFPPKYRLIFNGLHGLMSQKIEFCFFLLCPSSDIIEGSTFGKLVLFPPSDEQDARELNSTGPHRGLRVALPRGLHWMRVDDGQIPE
jgi:hypothetical protein